MKTTQLYDLSPEFKVYFSPGPSLLLLFVILREHPAQIKAARSPSQNSFFLH